MFQDTRNGHIIRQVHVISNEEELNDFFDQSIEESLEEDVEQINLVDLQSYENFLDENTVISYENLNEDQREIIEMLGEELNDNTIALEDEFEDIRLCKIEYSQAVTSLIT